MATASSVLAPLAELALASSTVYLTRFAYQLVIDPLYGSAAAGNWLEPAIAAAAVPAALISVQPRYTLTALACLLFFAPMTAYWSAVLTARQEREVAGPLVCHALVVAPIVTLALSSLQASRNLLSPAVGSFTARIVTSVVALGAAKLLNNLRLVSPNDTITFTSVFFSLGVTAAACSVYATVVAPTARPATRPAKGKKKTPAASNTRSWLLLPVPLVALFIASSLYPNKPLDLPWLNEAGEVRLLASKSSVTGRIVVSEHTAMGFRYLRADHSLLGGFWIETPNRRGETGDSIYTAFMLQEATRFVEAGPKDNALFIGLGIGVATNSFIRLGVNTTVVEIDPVVYQYAREFFNLREPQAVHFADARVWVHDNAALARPPQYDVIVHDCFSGGGVPAHIFTVEFWNDLKKILSPEGVLGVNYAGTLGSDTGRAILATLLEVFPQCRIFHDRVSGSQAKSKFLNMVFFCTASTTPLTFRAATPEDINDSELRRRLFGALDTLEIPQPAIFEGENATEISPEFKRSDWVLTDAKNPLGAWQDADALHHWHLMRMVLPSPHWEAF